MDLRGLALASVIASCARVATVAHEPTQAEWDEARRAMRALEQRAPTAYVARVQITLFEPRSRRTFEARGAIAVDPGRALRMVLVGPAGATALDAWVTRDQWRFHAPAIGAPRRGTRAPPELPVGFFRWWFLAPFEGRLLTAANGRLIWRQGDAVISARVDRERGRIDAERRTPNRVESLAWEGSLDEPARGERATYADEASGLRAEVKVESVSFGVEDPSAFVDPDAPGGVKL